MESARTLAHDARRAALVSVAGGLIGAAIVMTPWIDDLGGDDSYGGGIVMDLFWLLAVGVVYFVVISLVAFGALLALHMIWRLFTGIPGERNVSTPHSAAVAVAPSTAEVSRTSQHELRNTMLVALALWIPIGLLAGAFVNPWLDELGPDTSKNAGIAATVIVPIVGASITTIGYRFAARALRSPEPSDPWADVETPTR